MNCSRCDRKDLVENDFYLTSSGYAFTYCKQCHNKRSSANRKISRQTPENKIKDSNKNRVRRQDPNKRANVIVVDSKSADKKRGRKNDLTVEFVKDLIKDGCSYCGEMNLQMSVDRIDNQEGHIQSNVVSACIRCNFIRKDMPYQAWMFLVPEIKKVRELNIFGDWTGNIHRKPK